MNLGRPRRGLGLRGRAVAVLLALALLLALHSATPAAGEPFPDPAPPAKERRDTPPPPASQLSDPTWGTAQPLLPNSLGGRTKDAAAAAVTDASASYSPKSAQSTVNNALNDAANRISAIDTSAVLANLQSRLQTVNNTYYPALQNAQLQQYATMGYAYAQGGLETWTAISRSIRLALRTPAKVSASMLPIINPNAPMGPDAINTNFRNMVLPSAVFLVVCLVLFIFSLLCWPFLCCCVVCRGPKKTKHVRPNSGKIPKPETAPGLAKMKIVMGITLLFQLIFVICLVQGSAAFSRGLSVTISAIGNTGVAVQTMTGTVYPVVNGLLPDVRSGLEAAVDGYVGAAAATAADAVTN